MSTTIENEIKRLHIAKRSNEEIVQELHVPLDSIKSIREKMNSLEKESVGNQFPRSEVLFEKQNSQDSQTEEKLFAKLLLEQGFSCDTTGILSHLSIFKIRRLKGEVIKEQSNPCRCRNPVMRLLENPWGCVLCSIFANDYMQNHNNARRMIDFKKVCISATKTIQILKNEGFVKSFDDIENCAKIGTFYELARKLRECSVSGEEVFNKGRYKKLVRLGIDVDICQECGQQYLYLSSSPTKTCCFCELNNAVKNSNVALE